MNGKGITRRTFLAGAAAGIAGCATFKKAPGKISTRSPIEKMNVAGIGVGGKGMSDINSAFVEAGNVVALCDVDENQAAKAFEKWPNVPRYKDFRKMLEKEKSIDACTISTPDHTHAVAAVYAMALGKHVYVQKPLTHSIYEARVLRDTARKYNVATQMGNQGHSDNDVRELCELIWDDAIGDITEVHCWTDRPIWPQGIPEPLPEEPIPPHVDWDLWVGPAPMRPYNKGYCPFNWRGWWDFGCGALGDMACHIMDPANWALQLGVPISVECVQQEGNNEQTAPLKSVLKYEFPARKFREKYRQAKWRKRTLPPVTLYWHDGKLLPPRPEGVAENVKLGDGSNGTIFIGKNGVLTCGCYGGNPRFLPEEMGKDYKRPDPYIPRVGNSYKDWIQAAKGGVPACSNFDYAAPFTEVVLLGNLAIRSGKKIEWDSENMRVTNVQEANRFVKRQYREGWTLTT